VECLCGCGAELDLRQVDANLLAAEVALELAVWDRARALGSSVEEAAVAAQIESGTPHYPELLRVAHGEAGAEPIESDAKAWLESSRAARKQISQVLPSVPKKRVNFSDAEIARVDRLHPERTFSGGAPARPDEALPSGAPSALELELGSVLRSARDGGEDFERLAVGWLGRLVAERPPSLDELRWLLGRLEDARSGRIEEAEPGLRRFLADGA
jgi:hypothetical protein